MPRALWGRANAVDSNGYVIATLIGPPAAGALIAVAGGPLALAAVGAVFTVATLVMVGIPDPRPPNGLDRQSPGPGRCGSSLRGAQPNAAGAGLGLSVLNIGGGILQILVPVLLIDQLHQSPAVVGLAWAASGVTGLLAALFVGRIDSHGREKWLIVWPIVATAGAYALLLGPPQVLVIVAVLGTVGLASGVLDVSMFTIRQRRTAPAWTGRAFAVSMAFNFAGFPVGSALSGAIIGRSVELVVLLAVGSALVAAFLAWRLIPDRDPASERARNPTRWNEGRPRPAELPWPAELPRLPR